MYTYMYTFIHTFLYVCINVYMYPDKDKDNMKNLLLIRHKKKCNTIYRAIHNET